MTWTHGGNSINNDVGAKVLFKDSANLGSFGRLRVSNPTSRFDTQLQYDASPMFWEVATVGGGSETHNPDHSAVDLAVGTASGDKVTRQTRAYLRYQPGKSQFVLLTGVLGEGKSGVSQRIGYFDDDNGIFFECRNTEVGVVLRSKTSGVIVNDRIAQTSWNLDVMNGNGGSGIILDPSMSQIFVVDLEWLSVGRVRIGLFIDGELIYVHQFLNANNLPGAYMTTANLPARYEIENTGVSASNTSLRQICTSIISEGGFEEELGAPFSASNGATEIAVTTRRPILSIRPIQTFNGITNRGLVVPEAFSVFSEDTAAFIEIVYGGTLTNASFADVDATNSIGQRDIAADAISGGIVIASEFITSGGVGSNSQSGVGKSNLLSKLPLTLNIAGDHPTSPFSDSLSVVVTSMTGGATDCSGALRWRELR